MFNRSEILTAAWKGYRTQVRYIVGHRFNRKLFAAHLKSEWRYARGRAHLETLVAAEPVYSPRVAEVRNELRVMELSDGPTNWSRQRDLTAELFRLSAASTGGASHSA